MRLIAHRGFAATAPENTIAAIRAAAPRADVVEFDVRRCGSGELVVIHDETVDRVTDSTGSVAEMSLEALRELTVQGSTERIPTLEEMLAGLPEGVAVNLELKAEDIAADVLSVLEHTEGVENRIVVTSFLLGELETIRELDSTQPTGLLTSKSLSNPVTTAVELDCEVIGAHSRRCLFTRLVPRAKAADLEVHAWAVRGPYVARVLGWRGVDCISSDRYVSV